MIVGNGSSQIVGNTLKPAGGRIVGEGDACAGERTGGVFFLDAVQAERALSIGTRC